MSRVAKRPVTIAKGVEVKFDNNVLTAKGPKGEVRASIHSSVQLEVDAGVISVKPHDTNDRQSWAHAGTARALAANLVLGVSEGFERRLELRGVGYRAALQGKNLNLSLGFSHPVSFEAPEGVTIEVPSQTEIVIRGACKQAVGQVAAKIRGFRPPEPYKGKGVRYVGEHVVMKEAKKK